MIKKQEKYLSRFFETFITTFMENSWVEFKSSSLTQNLLKPCKPQDNTYQANFDTNSIAAITFSSQFYEIKIYIRYLFRFFYCLAHPNLSATFATDEKWPLCHLHISYQSLAGNLSSLQKSESLKLIILIFHVKKLNN